MVDVDTGLPPNQNTKKIIYESFKLQDNYIEDLENRSNRSTLDFYDSKKDKTILKFY